MENNISLAELFIILLIHWFADFVIQTENQAVKKSTSNKYLTQHVFCYSLVWLLTILTFCLMQENFKLLWFVPITFVCHWITDYFTSRLNTHLYNKKDYHNFFVSIGFDQLLHYIQLILTYKLLN